MQVVKCDLSQNRYLDSDAYEYQRFLYTKQKNEV